MNPSSERARAEQFQRCLAHLPPEQRGPVESVALRLIKIGSYHGSETDAITDALDVIGALLPHLDWPDWEDATDIEREAGDDSSPMGALIDLVQRESGGVQWGRHIRSEDTPPL